MIFTWKMEKTVDGNGRKNSTGIRAAGRTPGKAAGRLVTTHQKLLNRTIRCRITGIRIILIQETEHRIIYSNGMVYSRITLTGITAVNGTIILSGIIILRIIMSRIIMPRIITFRVIMPGIIILHGTLNLRQITICR